MLYNYCRYYAFKGTVLNMAQHKEDLRITKTRAALSGAFFEMLADMELSDITVNRLCEQSGVRRATFYKHFKDKDDFMIYIIKDVRLHFDTKIWSGDGQNGFTKDYYQKYAEALIAFFLRHESAMKRVATAPIRSTFIDVFLQQNYEDTKRRLEESVKGGMNLIASPDVVASMLIGGTSHCIIRWLESDGRCTPEKLIEDITSFIDRILS